MTMEWRGDADMMRRMLEYGQKVHDAVRQVATYWAPIIETYAKQNHVWVDRTGNATQGLHAFVEDLSENTVALYLSHGVSYGVFLELRYQGIYAIILASLEAHYQPVKDMLDGIFR